MTKAKIAKSFLVSNCDSCGHRIVGSTEEPRKYPIWCIPTGDGKDFVREDAPVAHHCEHYERHVKFDWFDGAL